MSEIKSFENWQDIDRAIRKIGELQIQIEAATGKLTERTNELKAATQAEIAPLEAEKKQLTTLVEGYCFEHKAAFAEKRSKELTFGNIGFRITHKMPWPRAAKKRQDLLSNIKNLGLSDCIRREEVVDKEKVSQLEPGYIGETRIKERYRRQLSH